MSYDYLFKYVIVGDSGVGKSCLLLQFTDKKFTPVHEMTIGVEFGSRNIQLKDKIIKIQIWDTAGQEAFRCITRSYYRASAGVMLCYDVTKRDTFDNLKRWIHEVKYMTHDQTSIILCGCKADLKGKRKVSVKEGKKLAEDNNYLFIEVSSKTGENVDESFINLATQINSKLESSVIKPGDGLGIKIGAKILNNGSTKTSSSKPVQLDSDYFQQNYDQGFLLSRYCGCN